MKQLFSTFLFATIYSVLFGHQVNFRMDQITLQNGLSQSEINCMIQDNQGYIWIGTNGGLNQFDGVSFNYFMHDASDTTSISNNIIKCLFQDQNGLIWIGTHDGLNIFDPVQQKFTRIKKDIENPGSLSDNTITAISQDSTGNYWVGTGAGGLNKLSIDEDGKYHFQLFQHVIGNPMSISSNRISSIIIDSYGFIWIGTADAGLNKLDPINGRVIKYTSDQVKSIQNNQINCLFEDSNQELWVGTDDGLARFIPNKGGRKFEKSDYIINYTSNSDRKYTLSNNQIRAITEDSTGYIWIGTNGGGINKFSKKNRLFYYNKFTNDSDNFLLSNSIKSLYMDKQGILWIGTTAGINKISRKLNPIKFHTREVNEKNSLSSNHITALYKETSGITWIGTYDGGLNKYDPNTGKYTVYNTHDMLIGGESEKKRLREKALELRSKRRKGKSNIKVPSPSTLNSNRILSLHRDKQKTLWIGTDGGGLNILTLWNNKITHIPANVAYSDSLSSNTIHAIHEDRSGNIWLGTAAGLNKYHKKKFKRYLNDVNNPHSISQNDVRCLAEDQNRNLWIGTYGGGLNHFDPKTEQFIAYRKDDRNKNWLLSDIIFCIKVDTLNNLWIGTANGLHYFDVEDEKFTNYNQSDGLPNHLIYGILDDEDGNLWVSTNHGISRFNIQDKSFNNLDENDGLQSNEFKPGACQKTLKGEMLFGGINGYNSFYPRKINQASSPPRVIFSDFKVNNQEVAIDSESILPKHISQMDNIVVSYRENLISFEFVAFDYNKPEKIKYQYQLENFDPQWVDNGTRRYATYTNLDPGKYLFKVKASNGYGSWDDEFSSIELKIKPPFWGTWWFKILLVIGFIALGNFAYNLRVQQIENQKVTLQKRVKEKTIEITKQKTEIEEKNAKLEEQKEEIALQRDLLSVKNKEITDQKTRIEEKNLQLERARKEVMKANNQLKKTNASLEEKIEQRTQKLRETLNQLLNTNKELDTFIYRASHDLKGPITRLLGLTMLAKLDNLKNNTQDFINVIEMNATDMNRMLNKLINVHEIDKENIQLSEVEIERVINEAKNSLDILAKDVKLNINLETEERKKIVSDEKLLKLVMANLLENALLYRNHDVPQITISLECADNGILLQVKDDGSGIPEKYRSKVFDMFFRGSEKSKGNGLGLYIVKKAIAKLNGNISLESKENDYTLFSIHLPQKEIYTVLEEQKS